MTQSGRTLRHVQLEPWEVGGELLDILSRGLYSDAKDALREYVQNGVDAHAEHVLITVDGSRTTIRDDGSGMDDSSIRSVRRFGMSEKSPMESVGYRGIGIYSSFGICDQMVITSKKAGMDHTVGWVFAFGDMRLVLENDKASSVRQSIGLPHLLSQHTELISEPYSGDPDDHFTVVEMTGIADEYRAQLNNTSEVNDYLLNTIPVAFPDGGYGSLINGWLAQHVGLNSIRVTLRVADESAFPVEPPVATNVYEPDFQWVRSPEGVPIAFLWHVLSNEGRQSEPTLSGFLLKSKGFTLGNRAVLRPLWPAAGGRTLYHHYTGEVHVLKDANVFPNAARNDLEAGSSKQRLQKAIGELFRPLHRNAAVMQVVTRSVRLLEGLENNVTKFRSALNEPNTNRFDLYRDVSETLSELQRVDTQMRAQLRMPRGGIAIQLNTVQQDLADTERRKLEEAMTALNAISEEVRTQVDRTETAPPAPAQPTPQEVSLRRALSAARELADGSSNDQVSQAVTRLERPVQTRLVPQAVGVLDELKASGVDLGEQLEGARKELRTLIGWSPFAPVTLEESLSQNDVTLETTQEEELIRSVDRGLIAGLGDRGERYESILRSITDAVVDSRGHQGA